MNMRSNPRVKVIVFSLLFFVCLLIVFLRFFPHIYSFYWMVKIWGPIELGEISVKLEKGMMYGIEGRAIVATFLNDDEKEGGLRIGLLDINSCKKSLSEFIEGMARQGFYYNEYWEGTYKGYRTFFFNGKGEKKGELSSNLIIIPKNVVITYNGPSGNYRYFKPVIDNLEFKGGEKDGE